MSKTQCPFDIELHREIWEQGYRAAEKDLGLTWFDIDVLYSIMLTLDKEKFPRVSVAFYKEVLKRFKEAKK